MELETEETEKTEKVETTEVTTSPLIENATNAASKLKMENDRMSELLQKQEELIARMELGGKSEAGKSSEEKPKELSDEEYANKMMAGEVDPLKDVV